MKTVQHTLSISLGCFLIMISLNACQHPWHFSAWPQRYCPSTVHVEPYDFEIKTQLMQALETCSKNNPTHLKLQVHWTKEQTVESTPYLNQPTPLTITLHMQAQLLDSKRHRIIWAPAPLSSTHTLWLEHGRPIYHNPEIITAEKNIKRALVEQLRLIFNAHAIT